MRLPRLTFHRAILTWRTLALAALAAVLLLPAGCSSDASAATGDGDMVTCEPPGQNARPVADTKLYIEHNAGDEDTGVHGLMDAGGWSKLCVYDPSGKQILGVRPMDTLGTLGLGAFFFESAEPPNAEISIAEHLVNFPAGQYEVRGLATDGELMTGSALFTHDIPAKPVITAPAHDVTVPATGLVATWEPVTETISGGPVTIVGYEVIITNEEVDDPNGMSQPILSAHVPPDVTSLTIPDEFMQAGTIYEIEVLALEVSGNQTIAVQFFETAQ